MCAFLLSSLASAILEIDEISAVKVGEEIEYTFLTTGVLPSLAELKTRLWAYMAPPIKRLEVTSIEPLESGPICKRFMIRAKGKTVGFLRR